MDIVPLANRPSAIPVIAGWYYEEWGYMRANSRASDIEADLVSHTTDTKLPQAYAAVSGADLIGAVELKIREVTSLPEYVYWLGGVYVDKPHRGKGIASEMAQHAMKIAICDYGIKSLYLQTEKEGGGLYTSLGWTEVTRIKNAERDRIIMVNQLA